MNIVNLAANGIKQNGHPDISTIMKYHPEVLTSLAILCHRRGLESGWIGTSDTPDFIVSGYRDHDPDPAVKNSPHAFGLAVDLMVSPKDAHVPQNRPEILDAQISWITDAIESNLFYRAGIYPEQNTIHLDLCDVSWRNAYNGTPFWVKWQGTYHGFTVLNEAVSFAKQMIQSKG